METVIEKRHKKFRARIKAHFAKKRAAASAKLAPKATHKPSPTSTAGKTVSYFKGKSTVIDLGKNPSQAAITGAASKLRAAKVSTTPKSTPNAASKAPKIKAPAAAKADPSNTIGRKAQFVAAGVAAAATATAVLASSVSKLPKKPPTVKLKSPTTTAAPKDLAARHDARRAKQGTALKHAFEGAERADFRKASDLSARHGARRAKQGTALRHAFEGAERADARKTSAQIATARSSGSNKLYLSDDGMQKRIDVEKRLVAKRAAPKVTAPTLKPPTAAPKPAAKLTVPKIESTGTGFYNEAGLKKVDERRAAERRQGAATRRQPGRLKQGTYADLDKTVQRDIAPQRGNRRKPSSDPRQGADAPKPKTNAQLQAEINVVKGEIAAKKAASAPADVEMIKAEVKVSQAKPTVPKVTPPKATGPTIPEAPKKPEVPKQTTAVPKISKPEAQKQYKELMLEAPRTVSEKQKKSADRKFYRDRNARISEVVNPTKPSNVPGQVQATAADQGSKNELQRRKNLKRIAELEIATADKGAQKPPAPQLKSPVTTAERFGTTEAEIAKVARKIDTVKPSEAGKKAFEGQVKASTDPEVKRIAKEIARVEAELKIKTPEVKTPKKVGEQLPRSTPKTSTFPSRESMLAEQRTAPAKPQTVPPKARPPMNKPVAGDVASSMKRYEQRQAAKNPSKPLKGPAIGLHAKPAVKLGKTLGIAALAFAALGGVEAGAKEANPKKRVTAGVKKFKADVPQVVKGIAEFTAKDFSVSKLIPSLVKKGVARLGVGAAGAAIAGGVARVAGRGLLALQIGRHALPYTGAQLGELASTVTEFGRAHKEAKQKKQASEQKYGTVAAATKTRHAHEDRKVAKRKQKDLIQLIRARDKKELRKNFGAMDV